MAMQFRNSVIIITVFIVLLLSACSDMHPTVNNRTEPYFSSEYQVKNYTDGEISTFGLNIACANEMDDWVVAWTDDISAKDGFQYLVYSDPDSWDVYLCYPNKNGEIADLKNNNVTVDFSNGVLKVYITEGTEKVSATNDTQLWILHFAAYPYGAWPTSVSLYWNDTEIPCDATK